MKRLRVLTDNVLTILMFFLIVIMLCYTSLLIWGVESGHIHIKGGYAEKIGILLFFGLIAFLAIALLVNGIQKNCGILEISHEGIVFYPLLCRSTNHVKRDFRYYPNIYYAYYLHGSWGIRYKVDYFVMTNKRLSERELQRINTIAPSADLIKIRYRRRTFSKLLAALPPHVVAEFDLLYKENIACRNR